MVVSATVSNTGASVTLTARMVVVPPIPAFMPTDDSDQFSDDESDTESNIPDDLDLAGSDDEPYSQSDAESNMEDVPVAPFVADDIAIAIAAAHPAIEKRGPGRPKKADTMKNALFDPEVETSQESFLHGCHELFDRHNTSHQACKEFHDLFQRFINPEIPTYKRTVNIIQSGQPQAAMYAMCPNDCWRHTTPLGDGKNQCNPAALGKIKCQVCATDLADANFKPKKVSREALRNITEMSNRL